MTLQRKTTVQMPVDHCEPDRGKETHGSTALEGIERVPDGPEGSHVRLFQGEAHLRGPGWNTQGQDGLHP